jgi:hypothetical protein
VDRIERVSGLEPGQAKRLRAERRRLLRGVYVAPDGDDDPYSLPNRARAALLVSPAGSVVCGLTALALIGTQLPNRLQARAEGPVHVLVAPAARRGPRREGVVVHREAQPPERWLTSPTRIAIAHPAHCWAQVAAELMSEHRWLPGSEPFPTARGLFTDPGKHRFLEAVQVADALMRRRHPKLDEAKFREHIANLGRRNGVRAIRELAGHARARTDSLAETWLRLIVWDAGFPTPEVNYPVTTRGQNRFLDLAWPELKIDLEFHGRQHFESQTQAFDDFQRRSQLSASGWRLVEAVNGDLTTPGTLIERLAAAFAAART